MVYHVQESTVYKWEQMVLLSIKNRTGHYKPNKQLY